MNINLTLKRRKNLIRDKILDFWYFHRVWPIILALLTLVAAAFVGLTSYARHQENQYRDSLAAKSKIIKPKDTGWEIKRDPNHKYLFHKKSPRYYGIKGNYNNGTKNSGYSNSKNEKSDNSVPNYGFDQVRPLTYDDIKKANKNLNKYPNPAVLSIPAIKIRTVINEGVSNDILAVGAGTMKAGQIIGEGNYALAGHNDFGYLRNYYLFANLKIAKVGQLITVTSPNRKATYKITQKKLIGVHDTYHILDSDLPKGRAGITLICCYNEKPGALTDTKHRLMVRGLKD